MKQEIILRPDKNREKLESKLAKQLEEGNLVDSIIRLDYNPWERGETPRVMLIAPYYHRIVRPLSIIEKNLRTEENSTEDLLKDLNIIRLLRSNGIYNLEEMKRAGAPMGLLRVGTAAKKKGYNVNILDAVNEGFNRERKSFETSEGSQIYTYGLTKEEIVRKIQDFNPHIVGISIDYTHQWGNAREIADLVKTLDEKAIVVMGGTHVNGLPEDALLDSPTDYVVQRQADQTFPELLDILTRRKLSLEGVRGIKGIVYRKDQKLVKTEVRDFFSNIDDIAIPDLSLINLSIYNRKYHSAGKAKLNHKNILYGFTSTGCDVRCRFCAIPPVQGGYTAMSDQTLDEYLKYITSKGVKEFIVEDDHLLEDPERALRVFDKLQENKLFWVEEGGISLFGLVALMPEVSEKEILNSVDNPKVFEKTIEAKRKGITTDHFIKRMAESGCYNIYLAVESANYDSLDNSNKPTLNNYQHHAFRIVKSLKENNIITTCGLMLGFVEPKGNKNFYVESRKQIENSISYGGDLVKSGAAWSQLFLTTPLPGAPNFKPLVKELGSYLLRNTDEGYTHEFGTMNAPNNEWTRDELSLVRVGGIIETIGIEGYKEILFRRSWPS